MSVKFHSVITSDWRDNCKQS